MKRYLLTLFLCLLGVQAFCQQKGHFLLGGGTSCIFGDGTADNPSNLMYSLEAGISYDLLENLRLTGGIGGFRSVMTFYGGEKQYESANGPLIWLGADYLFLPEGKAIRPSASLSIGYRRAIPRASNSADGAFLHTSIGTDFHLGGLSLNLSLTAELTQALHPSAGLGVKVLLP
jgi:hypothetical protein